MVELWYGKVAKNCIFYVHGWPIRCRMGTQILKWKYGIGSNEFFEHLQSASLVVEKSAHLE